MTQSNQEDAPAVLSELVQEAERVGASDIHLQVNAQGASVAFRLDGLLAHVRDFEPDLAGRVVGRIKYLARLKTYQELMPQDGRIGHDELRLSQDVRVSTYPAVSGEKVVLRLFTRREVPDLKELGIPKAAVEEIEKTLRRTEGCLLLTGPAGSGKTTTIYSCLRRLSEFPGLHVITIEDPVEQMIPGVMQTELNEARGLNYPKAMRHLLRQDPQVLVVGEIRDEETARLVTRAGQTGHLVISTLHAGSCRGVVERMLTMAEDKHAALSTIELILHQRLLRKICGGCSGAGCDPCLGAGYKGRVPVAEWLRLTSDLKSRIWAEGPGVVNPKQSLAQSATALVEAGITDQREVERVLGS